MATKTKEGVLWKEGESGLRWKKRYFVLQPGLLQYFEVPSTTFKSDANLTDDFCKTIS